MKCHLCGNEMVVKTNSKTGEQFWGCPAFPKCKVTSPLADKKENIKIIDLMRLMYEDLIIKELRIDKNLINIKHVYSTNVPSNVGAFTSIIDLDCIEIHWNVEVKFSNLLSIVLILAHEYMHIKQYLEGRLEHYDTSEKWRCRPEEEEAIKFSNDFINNIILNKI